MSEKLTCVKIAVNFTIVCFAYWYSTKYFKYLTDALERLQRLATRFISDDTSNLSNCVDTASFSAFQKRELLNLISPSSIYIKEARARVLS